MRVEADGPVPCPLMIVGEAPGYEEQQEGRPFVGKSGKELWAAMGRFCELGRVDFYITNIIKHGLPKNRDPKPQEIGEALPEFLDELERVQPEVVVTAGAFSTRAMLGDVKMADVHGIPHETEVAGRRYTVIPIYHPAAGLHNKGFLAAFAYDLGRFRGFREGKEPVWAPSPRPGRTKWLTDRSVGEGWGSPVAIDTEGWTEKPWGLSFSFNGDDGFVIRADQPALLAWLDRSIRDCLVVGHNILHDIPVLRAMGVHVDPAQVHDTQMLGYHDMIRTGSGVLEAESQNLGTLAYRECGLRLGELTDCAGVDLDAQIIPYSDEVMRYAGMDPIATWRLFDVYRRRGLTKYEPYRIDMSQFPLVLQMIETGIPFDADAATDYLAEVLEKITTIGDDLKATAARYGNRDFNPGSHDQVRDIITRRIGLKIRKRTKGGKASTNEKALADHQAHPFVGKLQKFRELRKLESTYLKPLLEELQ